MGILGYSRYVVLCILYIVVYSSDMYVGIKYKVALGICGIHVVLGIHVLLGVFLYMVFTVQMV